MIVPTTCIIISAKITCYMIETNKRENSTMKSKKTIYWAAGFAVMTAVGFVVIPPLMKKYSGKLYKVSAEVRENEIEDLSPEIVKKEDALKED